MALPSPLANSEGSQSSTDSLIQSFLTAPDSVIFRLPHEAASSLGSLLLPLPLTVHSLCSRQRDPMSQTLLLLYSEIPQSSRPLPPPPAHWPPYYHPVTLLWALSLLSPRTGMLSPPYLLMAQFLIPFWSLLQCKLIRAFFPGPLPGNHLLPPQAGPGVPSGLMRPPGSFIPALPTLGVTSGALVYHPLDGRAGLFGSQLGLQHHPAWVRCREGSWIIGGVNPSTDIY